MEQLKEAYSTSDLLKSFNLGRNTLRLYEEMGLFSEMRRTGAGYREYSSQHIVELNFILEAKDVGFTLSEIKSLLDLRRTNDQITCGTVSTEIGEKVAEIELQLSVLHSKKEFLAEFLGTCGTQQTDARCEVVEVGFKKKACCN